MKIKSLLICTIAALGCMPAFAATPKVIAHRGHWQAEGSAQNSIRSLAKADSVGCYGSEFDVWMSNDGELMVNHDAWYNGYPMEQAWGKTLSRQKLANGENMPYLRDYLAEAQKHPNLRLILEFKSFNNSERESEAVERILDLVKEYNLEDRTDYITFSKFAFQYFCYNAPESAEVYYLSGDYIPAQIKFFGGEGIDYYIGTLRGHPEWIKESQDLGLKVNVWTVDNPADMQWCIDQGVDFITTNKPEELLKMINKKK